MGEPNGQSDTWDSRCSQLVGSRGDESMERLEPVSPVVLFMELPWTPKLWQCTTQRNVPATDKQAEQDVISDLQSILWCQDKQKPRNFSRIWIVWFDRTNSDRQNSIVVVDRSIPFCCLDLQIYWWTPHYTFFTQIVAKTSHVFPLKPPYLITWIQYWNPLFNPFQ